MQQCLMLGLDWASVVIVTRLKLKPIQARMSRRIAIKLLDVESNISSPVGQVYNGLWAVTRVSLKCYNNDIVFKFWSVYYHAIAVCQMKVSLPGYMFLGTCH